MATESPTKSKQSGEDAATPAEHFSDRHENAFPIKFRFLEELKRRNVFRVAILYLIACWVILEPTHVVFHMLEVPEWANRLVILLMVIGFPLVLLFSWVYEVTPGGLKLTSGVDPAESIAHKTGRRLDRALIVVLSLALAYFVAQRFWPSRQAADANRLTKVEPAVAPSVPIGIAKTPPDRAPTMSLAISRFSTSSKDPRLIDMAEELPRRIRTILLICCHNLTIFSEALNNAAVGGAGASDRESARYVVEGDLQLGKNGSYATSLHLVDARSGKQIWSIESALPRIDGSFDSSARLHRLSRQIYHAVSDAETRRAVKEPIENLDALGLALRAWDLQGDGQTLQQDLEAKKLLEMAVEKDPTNTFALLSLGVIWDGINDVDPQIDRAKMLSEMERWTQLAVNRDSSDPLAWNARALALADAGRLAAAQRAIDRAMELDPFEPRWVEFKAWLMNMWGRPKETFPLTDQEIALDPENIGLPLRTNCEAHLLLQQWDQAIADCEKSAGINGDWIVTSFLTAAYANRGDMEKAVAAKNEILKVVPGYTIEQLRNKHYSDEPSYVKMAEATWYAGLRKAGIPEK